MYYYAASPTSWVSLYHLSHGYHCITYLYASDRKETVSFACQALYSLLDGADTIIVDAFIDQHVVERLREKLHELTTAVAKKQKPAIVESIIGTLDAIAACSTDEQLLELTCITPYLVDIVAAEMQDNKYSSMKKNPDKLLITTLTCVASICEGNSRILEKTFEYRRDDLFLTMFIKVLRSTLFIIVYTAPPRLNMEHYNCYLAIAFAVSAADAEQIDYFISLHTGVYGFLFDALISLDVGYKEHVKQVVKIILCTFNALCNLIKLKSANQEILNIQRAAESSGLASLHGWAKVRYLAYDYPTEVVAIPEEALKLYEMGIALGLVVSLNDVRRRRDEKEEG